MAISQEISYRLERLILDGGLAPEQKIPSERQLATRLGVSRAVIREALHELQPLLENGMNLRSRKSLLSNLHIESPTFPKNENDRLLEIRKSLE